MLGTAITEPSLLSTPRSPLVNTCKPPFAQKSGEVHLGILVACISLPDPQSFPSQRHFKEKI